MSPRDPAVQRDSRTSGRIEVILDAGAYLTLQLDTADELGEPIATTFYGMLYNGVSVEGTPESLDVERPAPPQQIPPSARPGYESSIAVAANKKAD